MASADNTVRHILNTIRRHRPVRATSLTLTLFGDTVSQHGGTIWLGSLIEALAPLGINEKLVRTSAFRLVREKWLQSYRVGRRSYYSLSEYGQREFTRAARRIYATGNRSWNGQWTLLMVVDSLPVKKRNSLREKLLWQGFGTLLPNLYAHPSPEHTALDEIIAEMKLASHLVVWDSAQCLPPWRETLRSVVDRTWNVPHLADDYQHFLQCFRAVQNSIPKDPQQCFQLRTLLIHEYRRILLRDPDLPQELLPPDWPGLAARNLTRNLYLALADGSILYVRGHLQSSEGKLPPPSADYAGRFCANAGGS